MSVRNEPTNTANAVATAASLGVPMTPSLVESSNAVVAAGASIADDHTLAEANSFNTTNVDHPLSRSVVVNIRASLNDLCLKKSKATWSPSTEAVRSILQQRRFTDLTGASESQGDLKERDCISLKPPLANTLPPPKLKFIGCCVRSRWFCTSWPSTSSPTPSRLLLAPRSWAWRTTPTR